MKTPRPSLWLSTLVVVSVVFLWTYVRLILFRESVFPLTFVIALLVCVWTRRSWQLWGMAAIFTVAAFAQFFWFTPATRSIGPSSHVFVATVFNIIVGAMAVQAILWLRDRLDIHHALISTQNAELKAQAEELSRQNEEINAQAEELAQQNEELEAQAEEVTRQNDELTESYQRIQNREDILHGLLLASRAPESRAKALQDLCHRTLDVLGEPASSVAILERSADGQALVLLSHCVVEGAPPLPERWPVDGSIGKVVLEGNRTAYVSDLRELSALAAPFDASGSVRSILATPVHIGGVPGAALVACSSGVAHWTQEQFRVVEWVAAQGALILEALHWQEALARRADEIEAAHRAKDNFLAALSHELRMPLTPVLMTASALRFDERLPEDVRAQLGMIERNIALEARLIDDLLDLTRIVKGKLTMRPQLSDAHSLIALAVEILRGDLQEKGIVLERDFRAAYSGLVADAARFQQVIWNLLRNALKFTPPGGRITLRTSDYETDDGGHGLRIEVADTGIGIDPAAMERIFQPFEQGGVQHDHRFGGLGLGLAIARAIVDLHGGRIVAKSAGTGRGATFIISFPGATAPPPGVGSGTGFSAARPAPTGTARARFAPRCDSSWSRITRRRCRC